MPSDAQVRAFAKKQQRAGQLTREYLDTLRATIAQAGILERYERGFEHLNTSRTAVSDEVMGLRDFLNRRLRTCLPNPQQHKVAGNPTEFDSVSDREVALLSQMRLLDQSVEPYMRVLGREENFFIQHDLPHQFDDITVLYSRMGMGNWEKNYAATDMICRSALARPDIAFGGLAYMRDEIAFLASYMHGITPTVEHVDLESMMQTVGTLLSGRANIYGHEFSVQDGDERRTKHAIRYSSDTTGITANPGALYAILYNYSKNSLKKLMEELKAGKHEDGASITLSVEDVSSEYLMILETDNGDPVCIDGFLNEVRSRLRAHDTDFAERLRTVSPRVARIMDRWSEGRPFAIHDLSVGDLTELVHVGGITGIGQHYGSGSGTGLLAVRYFAEAQGGKAIYTQSYATGGPIFGVLLPKDVTKVDPDKLERALGLAKDRQYRLERIAA